MERDTYMTCGEVRQLLRCTARSVRRYLDAGHFTAIEVNQRRFLYNRAEVEKFLATRHRRTAPAPPSVVVKDAQTYQRFRQSLPPRAPHGT